jgi:hypothetical protein
VALPPDAAPAPLPEPLLAALPPVPPLDAAPAPLPEPLPAALPPVVTAPEPPPEPLPLELDWAIAATLSDKAAAATVLNNA